MTKRSSYSVSLKPYYTGRLFYCYILDESIRHFRSVGSILTLFFIFSMENSVSKRHAVSDLGLQCLPMTRLLFFRLEWVKNMSCKNTTDKLTQQTIS